MNVYLLFPALLVVLRASAQLTVGSQALTILPGTPLTVTGLTLTPSATLPITNNAIQKSPSAVTGSPGSISRVYRLSAPLLFSGRADVAYLPAELNGYGESSLQLAYAPNAVSSLTVTTASSLNANLHTVSNTFTNKDIMVVTASALPDLAPTLSASPAIHYGTTNFSVVVEVFELNAAPTNGTVRVFITKDPMVVLSFSGSSTVVGGKTVQNGQWSFDALSDNTFYILTNTQGLPGNSKSSFGLTGVNTPGNTKGSLTITASVAEVTGGEVKITNNTDADKIDYFKK
ncbi:hypothetical protein [Spirosoma jeollabukense]